MSPARERRRSQMEYPLFMKLLDDGVIDIQKLFLRQLSVDRSRRNRRLHRDRTLQPLEEGRTSAQSGKALEGPRHRRRPRRAGPRKPDAAGPALHRDGHRSQRQGARDLQHEQGDREDRSRKSNESCPPTSAEPKVYATTVEELVDMLETGFQKQLTPLEIEIIKKWVERRQVRPARDQEGGARRRQGEQAHALLRRLPPGPAEVAREKGETAVKYDAGQPEALKNFFDSWPKK
ncbi:MAG: hypothetical protein MZU97_09740 [Bacillus subtilis]|nr:hypothetical protein [Bacillus subtilis]